MFSTGKPPLYPNRLRRTVKNASTVSSGSNGSTSKVASRLRRTVADYKKMSEEELFKAIKEQSAEMGLNNDPNIPDNVLNQLAEENQKYTRGTKGGRRRRTRRKSISKRKK